MQRKMTIQPGGQLRAVIERGREDSQDESYDTETFSNLDSDSCNRLLDNVRKKDDSSDDSNNQLNTQASSGDLLRNMTIKQHKERFERKTAIAAS